MRKRRLCSDCETERSKTIVIRRRHASGCCARSGEARDGISRATTGTAADAQRTRPDASAAWISAALANCARGSPFRLKTSGACPGYWRDHIVPLASAWSQLESVWDGPMTA